MIRRPDQPRLKSRHERQLRPGLTMCIDSEQPNDGQMDVRIGVAPNRLAGSALEHSHLGEQLHAYTKNKGLNSSIDSIISGVLGRAGNFKQQGCVGPNVI